MKQYIVEVWNTQYNHLHSQQLIWASSEADAIRKAPMLYMPNNAIQGEFEFRVALPDASQWETKA